MLLGQRVGKRHRNIDLAGCNAKQASGNALHETLAGEAGPNGLLVVRIAGRTNGHADSLVSMQSNRAPSALRSCRGKVFAVCCC